MGELRRKPPCPQEACEDINNQCKKVLDDIKKWLKEPANHPSSWSHFEALSKNLEQLFVVFKKDFESLKNETGQFEMSDLELLTYQVTQKEPQLCEEFSRLWNYWFVDEYQDTSPLQVKILNKLIGARPSFIVGDPQQSIYLFRGARSEVFTLKEKEILENGGELSVLNKNYRSQPELLHFFNDFFSNISPHFKPMKPRDHKGICKNKIVATYSIAHKGDVSNVSTIKTGENHSEKRQGLQEDSLLEKPVNLMALGTESRTKNEDIAIYNYILNLLSKGQKHEDICILAKTHNHLNNIASFLDSKGLPTHIHGFRGFHERREILDALGILKFIINPHDNFNLINILRSPWFHVEDSLIVDKLADRPHFYWETLSSSLKEHKSIQSLVQLLRNSSKMGVNESFKRALVDCGIFDLARHCDPSGRRESNLWKLVTCLEIEQRRSGFNYLKFIYSLSEGEWAEAGDAVACLEPQSINLMTIHASKGLKFRNVILPRMDRKPLLTRSSSQKPLINVDEDTQKWTLAIPLGEEKKMSHSPVAREVFEKLSEKERAESDRLLYVALTRAEESVFLSWVKDDIEKGSWAEKIQQSLQTLKIPQTSNETLLDLQQEEILTTKNYSLKIQRGSWKENKIESEDKVSTHYNPLTSRSHEFSAQNLMKPVRSLYESGSTNSTHSLSLFNLGSPVSSPSSLNPVNLFESSGKISVSELLEVIEKVEQQEEKKEF